MGDKDIFSSLEPLAQQWIIIRFQGKTQTIFFLFQLIFVPIYFQWRNFHDNVWANAEE